MLTTLVLVEDTEYDLQISISQVLFPKWGTLHKEESTKHSTCFAISLKSHEQSNCGNARIPLVITAPFTSRFELHSPELSTPLLPMLHSTHCLEYNVVFHPPPRHAPDSMWDNFQDQIVIQTRLSKLVLPLYALREASHPLDCLMDSFSPRSLPEVRAPSFRLFDQIDKAYQEEAALIRPRSSFKRPNLLTPLSSPSNTRTNPSRPSSSSKITASPRLLDNLTAPSSPPVVSSDISTELEAREVIRRMRAQRATQQATSIARCTFVYEPMEPESQFRTQAEVAAFNEIVKMAKVGLDHQRTKAKQELEYYKLLQPPSIVSGTTKATPRITRCNGIKPHTQSRLPTLTSPSSSNNVIDGIDPPPSKVAISLKPNRVQLMTKPLERKKSKPVIDNSARYSGKSTIPEQIASIITKNTTIKKKTAGVSNSQRTTTRLPMHQPCIQDNDHALHDFDDSDPEMDQAPVFQEDLRQLTEEEELDYLD